MRDKPVSAVFTIPNFVDWSNVSRTKTYALIASGELRSFKLGARRLIRRDDAIAWLNAAAGADGAPAEAVAQ